MRSRARMSAAQVRCRRVSARRWRRAAQHPSFGAGESCSRGRTPDCRPRIAQLDWAGSCRHDCETSCHQRRHRRPRSDDYRIRPGSQPASNLETRPRNQAIDGGALRDEAHPVQRRSATRPTRAITRLRRNAADVFQGANCCRPRPDGETTSTSRRSRASSERRNASALPALHSDRAMGDEQ
jgi:hypothetical protein